MRAQQSMADLREVTVARGRRIRKLEAAVRELIAEVPAKSGRDSRAVARARRILAEPQR